MRLPISSMARHCSKACPSIPKAPSAGPGASSAEPSPLVRTANPEEIMEDEAGMNPI